MLRVLKNTGRVTSSANDKPTANSKGRVEVSLSTNQETQDPVLQFCEYGNYGRLRWNTTVQLTREEVEAMVHSGQEWLDYKTGQTLPVYVQPTQERDVQVTEESEETFEVVNGNR